MIRALTLALALAASGPAGLWAASASPRSVHLAVFRRTHFELSMPLAEAFERLLLEGGTRYALLRVENLPSHFNGGEYMYRLPPGFLGRRDALAPEAEQDPEAGEVEVLETSGGYFALMPPDPGLMERFIALAKDPASYRSPSPPRIVRRRAQLATAAMADGSAIRTLRIRDSEGVRYLQWRNTVALTYRLRAPDPGGGERTLEAVFLYKTLGGEGRLASALTLLKRRHGEDLLALNRGEIFVEGPTKTTGTAAGYRFEEMGVRAAVVGAGELYRLDDMLRYVSESPEGVRFLSANLVYSTDTARTLLPAYHVFEVGGTSVAVLGLTREHWARHLNAEHARRFSLKDAVEAAQQLVPLLREKADIIVALSNLTPLENARLKAAVGGIDLIAGDTVELRDDSSPGTVSVYDPERGRFDEALLVTSDRPIALTHVELETGLGPAGAPFLAARQEQILLDETLLDRDGYPKFNPEGYGVSVDTSPPILPSARKLYADRGPRAGYAGLDSRDFWSLAASLAAERARAEAGFLPIYAIDLRTMGDFQESLVREWFRWEDRLVVFELPGADLQALLREARRQARPGESVPVGGLLVAAGGVGEGDTIHGVPVDGKSVYRVAATERLLAQTSQFASLRSAREVEPLGALRDVVLEELRRRAAEGWPPERYRPLLKGLPVRETGFWKVNFRDISLNLSNNKVVSDPAFANVPNPRVRGFDELLIGAAAKIDVEYYRGPVKWTNTGEVEYARSRLRPPGQAEILNTPKNNSLFRTEATRRVGSFPYAWIAKSYGPSLGLQYEGHVERLPFQRRRHVFSVLPGVELFGGDFFRSVILSANLRRDFTPPVPLNNYGVRARALFARSVGRAGLQGDLFANYFIRTSQDTAQDLRLEASANVKLNIPVAPNLSVGPFLDFYYFILKIRPVTGYSSILGISLSFSRLWKPQYESF